MVEQSGRDVAEKAMSTAPVVVQFALASFGGEAVTFCLQEGGLAVGFGLGARFGFAFGVGTGLRFTFGGRSFLVGDSLLLLATE